MHPHNNQELQIVYWFLTAAYFSLSLQISSTNAKFESQFTIEGGGSVVADTLHVTAAVMQIDASGSLDASGRGMLLGLGAGQGNGGAGHGGRGDAGTTSGKVLC